MAQPPGREANLVSTYLMTDIWLYHRFSLSFRDIEDLFAERGIGVDPLSWIPDPFRRRIPRCPKHELPIHRPSGNS